MLDNGWASVAKTHDNSGIGEELEGYTYSETTKTVMMAAGAKF